MRFPDDLRQSARDVPCFCLAELIDFELDVLGEHLSNDHRATQQSIRPHPLAKGRRQMSGSLDDSGGIVFRRADVLIARCCSLQPFLEIDQAEIVAPDDAAIDTLADLRMNRACFCIAVQLHGSTGHSSRLGAKERKMRLCEAV